jgi:histidinol-phosphatase
MSDRDPDALLAWAEQTVRGAGAITLEHFGSVEVERKEDGSEVTAADREAEVYLRDAIAESFPDDAILGEEGSEVEGTSRRRWVVDPIDGTRSFASGVPLYGVLLALEDEGRPVLGCCHFPALSDTLIAHVGAGAWFNGHRARVSDCDDLAEARVVTSGFEYWRDWADDAGRAGWDRLVRASRFARTWGDSYGYALVATGRADLMADAAAGAHWDLAPMIPILAEAGGRYTTLSGDDVSAWSSALASNGHLHRPALDCWR